MSRVQRNMDGAETGKYIGGWLPLVSSSNIPETPVLDGILQAQYPFSTEETNIMHCQLAQLHAPQILPNAVEQRWLGPLDYHTSSPAVVQDRSGGIRHSSAQVSSTQSFHLQTVPALPQQETGYINAPDTDEMASEIKKEILDFFLADYPSSPTKTNTIRDNIVELDPVQILSTTEEPKWHNRSDDYTCCKPTLHSLVHSSGFQGSQGAPEKATRHFSARSRDSLTPEVKREILDLFDKGHTRSYITWQLKLSRESITQMLCDAGKMKKFRKNKETVYEELRPVIEKLFKKGWSYQTISECTKIEMKHVEEIIRGAG